MRSLSSFLVLCFFLHSVQRQSYQFDVFKELVSYLSGGFDPLQFIEYCLQLVFQSLVNFRIALNDDISFQTSALTVFLLGKAGKINCRIQLLIFLRRYAESNSNASPAVTIIHIFS